MLPVKILLKGSISMTLRYFQDKDAEIRAFEEAAPRIEDD